MRQRGYSSAELRDGGGGAGAGDFDGSGGELHGAPTATTPASRLVDCCMTEDGSSIICAGATLEVASLLVVRSAGCTKAEAPARVSAKMERRMPEEAGRRGGSVVSPDTTAIELARLILPGRSAPSANFANNEVPSLRLAAGQHQRLDVQRAAEPNLFARNRHASRG